MKPCDEWIQFLLSLNQQLVALLNGTYQLMFQILHLSEVNHKLPLIVALFLSLKVIVKQSLLKPYFHRQGRIHQLISFRLCLPQCHLFLH